MFDCVTDFQYILWSLAVAAWIWWHANIKKTLCQRLLTLCCVFSTVRKWTYSASWYHTIVLYAEVTCLAQTWLYHLFGEHMFHSFEAACHIHLSLLSLRYRHTSLRCEQINICIYFLFSLSRIPNPLTCEPNNFSLVIKPTFGSFIRFALQIISLVRWPLYDMVILMLIK